MGGNGLNIREYETLISSERGWTDCFREAVKELEKRGGGRIYVPAGRYKTASIQLKNHMELYLEAGAVLDYIDDYSVYETVASGYETDRQKMYMPFIYASGAEDVAVTGYGKIDGHGERWWKEKDSLDFGRPSLICFENCCHVKLEGITLLNSPSWTVHPLFCEDVIIQNVTIKNPKDSPNTDGIDPDSCVNVRISGCLIDVGDDCIAIKSGTEASKVLRPCENIVITGCHMIHGHGGVVIGSEMSGSVRNVVVSDCVFQNTDRGIRLKTRRGRGGIMERMMFHNIIMEQVMCPFVFNMYYFCGEAGKAKRVWDKSLYQTDITTPLIRNIMIDHVMVYKAGASAGFFYGLPEQPIENLSLTNCVIDMDPSGLAGIPAMMDHLEPMQMAGLFMRHVKEANLANVKINGAKMPEIDFDESVEWQQGKVEKR